MSNNNTKCGYSGISKILYNKGSHIHFCGAGGVGMYSLIRLAVSLGMRVSATDKARGVYTERLEKSGITVSYGADLRTVCTARLVVYSLAVDARDEELVYARALGIPCVSRADFLSYLMEDYKTQIAIMGTHGKSTVTAMVNSIFSVGGINPTTVSGAALSGGEPLVMGGSEFLIYEACEYRDSFLCMRPSISAVTNIEYDHPDYFKDLDAVCESFLCAINSSLTLAVLPCDDKNLRTLLPRVRVPYVTYGVGGGDYEYGITSLSSCGSHFTLKRHSGVCESFFLSAIGAYNVTNAVCAAVVALECGIPSVAIREALSDFRLPERRLERVGNYRGREVLYDYAHHPSEIAFAIAAVRSWYSEEITVIFRPHTYTRTAALWEGFVRSLSLAEHVLLCDIYAAREEPIFDISSKRLAEDIGERAVLVNDADVLSALDKTSGAIIIMGAGNLDVIKEKITERTVGE